MNAQKIKKIKEQLEAILNGIILKSKREGVNTEDEIYKLRLDAIRKKALQKLGVSIEDYNNVDSLLAKQGEELKNTDISKEIFAAVKDMSIDKLVMDISKELMPIKIRLSKLENKKPTWSDIENKPFNVIKPFTQNDINQLKFSQLAHADTDHINIYGSIRELQEKDFSISKEIEDAKQELFNAITDRKINHSELIGVGPDDHHKEYHTLESHIGSDLMDKLKRLISGGVVDDLHKHAHNIIEREVAFGGWITSNDNIEMGEHYLEFEEISTPSNPTTDKIRMYAKDSGGVTKIYTLNSAGTETQLGAGSSTASYIDEVAVDSGDGTIFTISNSVLSGSLLVYNSNTGQIYAPTEYTNTTTSIIFNSSLTVEGETPTVRAKYVY